VNKNPCASTRFGKDRQPPNRGRKKSIFGPLEKENDLSLDDVRKVFKNILTAKGFDSLNEVKENYPTTLTIMTVEMLRQDYLGKLTGRKVKVKKKTGEVDEKGKDIYETVEVDERIKSYETIRYMLDRCFGEPARAEEVIPQDFVAPNFYEGSLADDPA
jgi:hypothetical protein